MGASSTHGPGTTPAGRGSRRFRLSKRTWVALAATITLAMGITIPALAVVSGSPSLFESNDGNMTADVTADWNCFANGNSSGFTTSGTTVGPGTCNVVKANAQALHPDFNNPSNAEVAWKSGQKLDASCPVLLTSSVPNKDDFTGLASYSELDSSGNIFLYGGEIRAVANGNSSGNVELNQAGGTAACPINRTAGDVLLAFDFLSGGTTLDFHALTWITVANPTAGGNNGTCDISHDSPPCWGAHVIDVATTGITVGGCGPLTTQNDVEGCSNQSEITPANNGIDGTNLVAQRFAEFGVNLTKVVGLSGCGAFAQQVWESRTSGSSFTSNPEDIEIQSHKFANCGTTTVTTPSVGSGGTTAFNSFVTDTAVVTASQSGGGFPSGTVTFFICNPTQVAANGGTCSTGGTQIGSPVTTTDNGTSPPSSSATSSPPFQVNQTGTWCFRGVYTPGPPNGGHYTGSSDASTGECFTVNDTTASASAQNWLPNDTGTVSSTNGAPLNGTLTIQLYASSNCDPTTAVSGQSYSTPLTNATSPASLTTTNGADPANTYKVTATGTTTVSWLVTFTSTDTNVTGSSHCETTSLTINNNP
jgi:hypothetical protein